MARGHKNELKNTEFIVHVSGICLVLTLIASLSVVPDASALSYTSKIVHLIIAHSKIYEVLLPRVGVIGPSATRALKLEVTDYYGTILAYYDLTYDPMLRNRLEECAQHVGMMLVLMLRTSRLGLY